MPSLFVAYNWSFADALKPHDLFAHLDEDFTETLDLFANLDDDFAETLEDSYEMSLNSLMTYLPT